MMGYINSIETMGLVDGPGIRFVVFMQGCNLRCVYCHNPETWQKKGNEISSSELLKKILRYKNYFGDTGGVTFSGGEALLQPLFVSEVMKMCHDNGINTVLDTAGVGTDLDYLILENTDLVILDVKSSFPDRYKKITGFDMKKFNNFLSLCQKMDKKLWIRQVIVPGINDDEDSILHLCNYLKGIKNIEKVELLPYHSYATGKYKKLNIKYLLEGVSDMDLDKIDELRKILDNNFKCVK